MLEYLKMLKEPIEKLITISIKYLSVLTTYKKLMQNNPNDVKLIREMFANIRSKNNN